MTTVREKLQSYKDIIQSQNATIVTLKSTDSAKMQLIRTLYSGLSGLRTAFHENKASCEAGEYPAMLPEDINKKSLEECQRIMQLAINTLVQSIGQTRREIHDTFRAFEDLDIESEVSKFNEIRLSGNTAATSNAFLGATFKNAEAKRPVTPDVALAPKPVVGSSTVLPPSPPDSTAGKSASKNQAKKATSPTTTIEKSGLLSSIGLSSQAKQTDKAKKTDASTSKK